MDTRFRIRTREGEEFAPKTVAIFSELVRSGVVRPQDLVFDELTGTWAPASAHPMVRLFQDPLVVDPTAELLADRLAEDHDVALGTAAPGDRPGGGLALDLVEPDAPSPEEEARAFIAKMDEERRSDPDTPALSHEVPLVDMGVGAVVGRVPSPDPGPQPRTPSEGPRPVPVEEPMPVEGPMAVEEWMFPAEERRFPKRGSGPTRSAPRAWGNALILGGAVAALILSVLWPPGGVEDALEAGVAQTGDAGPTARAVPVTEEQTRAMALTAYLEGVDALREELGVWDVPRAWLEGRYLADPGAYPEVRLFWEQYLAFVDAARAAEVTLYRGAYLEAAAAAGLAGPVRSLRLAAAQERFAASRSRREGVYARVEGLARAAIALDALLVEMKGRVTYEPIAGAGVSADPVIEAAGTDADAQARLEAALDRVLGALQRPGGDPAQDRAGVPGWLAEGLREVEEGR